MRTFLCLVLGLGLLLSSAGAEEAQPWLDYEKCAFCKHFAAEEGLIDHISSEYYNLTSGIFCLLQIDEGYGEAFKRAEANMVKVGEEMQRTGEVPYMCGHCQAYGEFMTAGVAPDCVETSAGWICVMTGQTPEMIEKLHAFGEKSNEAFKQAKGTKAGE